MTGKNGLAHMNIKKLVLKMSNWFQYREAGSSEDNILNTTFNMEAEVPPAPAENECPVRTQTNPAYEHEEDDTQVI